MRFDADYVIVGGGCAGLSLAVHMLDAPSNGRVILLEPRTHYERDRTWCSFGTSPHAFAACVTHRWNRWRVCSRAGSVERGSTKVPYEHIPADVFYREAQARLAQSRKAELRLGVRVQDIVEEESSVRIETDAGMLRARAAFDSRPVRTVPSTPNVDGEVRLLQHFVGWFVEASKPVLEPDVATLMDFRVDQERGIHFVYVLPFDREHALVEDTWFTEAVLPDAVYEDELGAYLSDHYAGTAFRVTARERGVIPMTTEAPTQRVSQRVYRIGLAGGMAKPSSGYAFRAIQRWSQAFAGVLAHDVLPDPPAPRSARAQALDRIFLSYLRRHPDRAPDLFRRLFARAPAESLARFLNEESSVVDEARVMAAMPRRALAIEAVRSRHLFLQR